MVGKKGKFSILVKNVTMYFLLPELLKNPYIYIQELFLVYMKGISFDTSLFL